jgi:5-methylcytosine-specific restriction endonuclease McrA
MYKNKEKEKLYKHEYYIKHKRECLLQRKTYRNNHYKENLIYNQIYAKIWRKKNPEKAKEIAKNWRNKNPNYAKKYYNDNKQYFKEYSQNRKQLPTVKLRRRLQKHKRKILCNGMDCKSKFSKKFLSKIFTKLRKQEYKCIYCGIDIGNDYTIDHIIPISKGGAHEVSNMELLCSHCNSSKGSKTKEKFLEYLEGRIQPTATRR